SGRAQRHLVVLGKDGVDVTVALEHVGHHVQTTGAVEVGGLLRDDLDVVVLGDTLAEALTTFTARRGTRGALKHHDPALFTDLLCQHLRSQTPTLDVVRGHQRLGLGVVDRAVGGHHRHTGDVGPAHRRPHCVGDHRGDHHRLHPGAHDVLDLTGLSRRVVLGFALDLLHAH